jgi:hypothetical protein
VKRIASSLRFSALRRRRSGWMAKPHATLEEQWTIK